MAARVTARGKTVLADIRDWVNARIHVRGLLTGRRRLADTCAGAPPKDLRRLEGTLRRLCRIGGRPFPSRLAARSRLGRLFGSRRPEWPEGRLLSEARPHPAGVLRVLLAEAYSRGLLEREAGGRRACKAGVTVADFGALMIQARKGTLPEGFDRWGLADWSGWTVRGPRGGVLRAPPGGI
jgi:hypothetical protein